MTQTDLTPDPEVLRHFDSLEDLSPQQLALLAQSLKLYRVAKGSALLHRGDTEEFSLLLLSGAVELVAGDGRRKRIHAGSPNARTPIAQLIPRRYDVSATEDVSFVKLDVQLLELLRESATHLRRGSEFSVHHGEAGIEVHGGFTLDEEALLIDRIRSDLDQGHLLLPSLPEIALRIGRALNDKAADAERIARMIESDPVMTTKIVRAANSALYAARARVNTCTGAVVRLGVDTTHKLVLSFALREVFRTESTVIRRYMEELWRHSTRVAAICYVLATLTRRFDPEHAMLAGLVHDIGNVAILGYAEKMPELGRDPQQLEHTMATLKGSLGAMILESWEFSPDLVTTAQEAEYWTRNPNPEADFCDLVIVAQLHSYVGTARMPVLPHLGQLPCFAKLHLGELTPRLSLKILEKAEGKLRAAERLLGS
jgi:HD-like signal output (HDOD) protein